MAIKQLMIARRLAQKKEEREGLLLKLGGFAKREEELESSLDEAATEEEMAAVEEEANKLETEQNELNENKSKLDGEIEELEKELEELNSNAPAEATRNRKPAADKKREKEYGGEETRSMEKRRYLGGMTRDAALQFIQREEVNEFLVRVRNFIGEKRAVTGAELEIPDVFLEILRDTVSSTSKLLKYTMVKSVSGKARQTITGAVPEAVWMEAVGSLNELAMSFGQVEVDAYKVGGFIPVPNSTLEDTDLNLAQEIFTTLSFSIGLALDKAILYGNGVKMMTGVSTRLAQTSKPESWGVYRPAWTDLHTTHVTSIDGANLTGIAFFAALMEKMAIARSSYQFGEKVWVMNESTYTKIMIKSMEFNAAGAIVAMAQGKMPVIGGTIEQLECVPDNDIIGGYLALYLVAERTGGQFAQSEHERFSADQTVFRGSARYDGQPVFGEGFVAININNTAPATSATFPQDVANTVAAPTALPIGGSYTGAQSVYLFCNTPGADIYYTVDGSTPSASSAKFTAPIAVAASATIKAIAIKSGLTNSNVLSAAYTIS
ncbi:MAG: phage major capsid protein [Anaerofustis sp.]